MKEKLLLYNTSWSPFVAWPLRADQERKNQTTKKIANFLLGAALPKDRPTK